MKLNFQNFFNTAIKYWMCTKANKKEIYSQSVISRYIIIYDLYMTKELN